MKKVDLDAEISFWLKDVPYLWVSGESVEKSKRFYILGDCIEKFSFFDEKNEFVNVSCFEEFVQKQIELCMFPIDLECKLVRSCFGVYIWGGWKSPLSIVEAIGKSPYKNASVRIEGKVIKKLPDIDYKIAQDSFTVFEKKYKARLFLHDLSFSRDEDAYNCEISRKISPSSTGMIFSKTIPYGINLDGAKFYCSEAKAEIIRKAHKTNNFHTISKCTTKNFRICKLPHIKTFSQSEFNKSLMNQISKNYKIHPNDKLFDALFSGKGSRTKEFILFLKSLTKKPFLEEERGEKKAKEVLDMLPRHKLDKSSVVLDFGAGDGIIIAAVSRFLGLNQKNAIAIDLKVPPPSKFYTHEIDIKNVKSNSVDCIILFEVLHHINPKYHEGIVKELKRCLKYDGVIVVKEHDFPEENFYEYRGFLDLIHEMWYEYKGEERDYLWPIENSATYIGNLMFPLSCTKVDMWTKNNYQRIFRAAFSFGKMEEKISQTEAQTEESRIPGSYKKVNGKFVFVPF